MEETIAAPDIAPEGGQPVVSAPEAEAGQGAQGEDKDPAPRKSGLSRRIDELVKLREEARRDADYWRKMALEKIDAGKKDAPVGKPDPSQFKAYDDYVEALTDYKLREKSRSDAEERRLDEELKRLAERVARAEERYPDFRKVAMNPDLPITPAMYGALADSPAGADIAYYLGKNPLEAERIAGMTPIAAVKEIGRLEARIHGRRVTQAPAPIRTLSGVSGTIDKPPSEMSMEEYKAWRKGGRT